MTDPKTKKVLTGKGKYVTVYKRQADGGWKAVADIWNEDAPPAPANKECRIERMAPVLPEPFV
jgi:hypothetical protein